MKLSLTVEGMFGLTWTRWQHLVTKVERLGFAGLFRSDHFTLPSPPDYEALEAIVSLTYVALQSSTLHFGTLVAPVSFRDPVMLARQAMALDDLSGGRMILGVGAGWMAREHTMFGYALGDAATRFDRLDEALAVMMQLIHSDEPVTFTGRFYSLQDAQLLPRPQRPTPILVGGSGPKRTLPLVARYADIWNCVARTPAFFAKRSAQLDALLRGEGRRPQDVKRTLMVPVLCWLGPQELSHRLRHFRPFAPYNDMSTAQILDSLREEDHAILGTPEQVIEQMQEYADAGVEEMMIQWISLDDMEGLEVIAEYVLPRFMT